MEDGYLWYMSHSEGALSIRKLLMIAQARNWDIIIGYYNAPSGGHRG